MQKKVLVLFMAIGMAFGVYSQDRVAIEKEAVKTRSTEFFAAIKDAFAKHDKWSGPNWYAVGKNGKQFAVDDVTKFGISENKKIQKQFDKLENDKKLTANVVNYDYDINPAQSDETGVNCYTSEHEVAINATKGDIKSVAKNKVTIKWKVYYDKFYVDGNWKKKSFGERGKAVKIVSIEATQVDMLSAEKSEIADNVNEAIKKWYKDINNNVDFGKMGVDAKECVRPIVFTKNLSNMQFVSADDITNAEIITVGKEKNAPTFNVQSNNPWKYVAQGTDSNYTNPEASWDVQPTFTLSIDMETKKVEITNVKYETPLHFNGPEVDDQKMAKLRAAQAVADEFGAKLNQYAQNPQDKSAKQLKKEMEEMFVGQPGKDKSVQFTLIKDGTEDQKYVDQPTTFRSYLQHLPPSEINMTFGTARFGESTSEVVIPFNQTYKQNNGKKYADQTDKEIYLKYDEEKAAWLIEKITAKKGSTVLVDGEK